MDKIEYFPSGLLSLLYAETITRQEYFSQLLSTQKVYQNFNSSYMNFCRAQDNDTYNGGSDCLLFRGICTSMFAKKPTKHKKDWKKSIVNECSKLNKKCFWANIIPTILKKANEKYNLLYQNEITSLNFIYCNESDEDFYNFSKFFHEKLLSSKQRISLKKELFHLDDSDYLDSELYSRAKSKEYETYYPISTKSLQKCGEAESYQNNTIIENNKNCFHNDMNPQKIEEALNRKKKGLSHYKLITDVIQDHIEQKSHPLNLVKEKFIQEFVNFFGGTKSKTTFINNEEKYKLMVANLIEFIRIFQQSVVIFYGLVYSKVFIKTMTYFTQENLLEFITSLFINNDKIYDILIEASIALNEQNEEKIEKNYGVFSTFHPQTFGISKEFCLNYKTIHYFKGDEETLNTFKVKELSEPHFDHIIERKITWDINEGNSGENSFSLKSPLSMQDRCLGFLKPSYIEEKNQMIIKPVSSGDFCKNFKKSLLDKTLMLSEHKKEHDTSKKYQTIMKDSKNSKEMKENEDKTIDDLTSISHIELPYELAITNLKKISRLKSPIHKLKNILKTAVLIIECIKKFYEKHQRNFNEEISSDEIMSILIYICCKSEIKSLYSQCVLVESFLTNQLSTSVAGYYLITLKASLEYIGSEEMLAKTNSQLQLKR